MRITSDKKSLSSRLVHSICVRVNPAFDSSNQEAESYNELFSNNFVILSV